MDDGVCDGVVSVDVVICAGANERNVVDGLVLDKVDGVCDDGPCSDVDLDVGDVDLYVVVDVDVVVVVVVVVAVVVVVDDGEDDNVVFIGLFAFALVIVVAGLVDCDGVAVILETL